MRLIKRDFPITFPIDLSNITELLLYIDNSNNSYIINKDNTNMRLPVYVYTENKVTKYRYASRLHHINTTKIDILPEYYGYVTEPTISDKEENKTKITYRDKQTRKELIDYCKDKVDYEIKLLSKLALVNLKHRIDNDML